MVGASRGGARGMSPPAAATLLAQAQLLSQVSPAIVGAEGCLETPWGCAKGPVRGGRRSRGCHWFVGGRRARAACIVGEPKWFSDLTRRRPGSMMIIVGPRDVEQGQESGLGGTGGLVQVRYGGSLFVHAMAVSGMPRVAVLHELRRWRGDRCNKRAKNRVVHELIHYRDGLVKL